MAKHHQPYTLVKREGIFYVRMEGEKKYKSLGTRNPAEAKQKAKTAWEHWQSSPAGSDRSLGEALEPYYSKDCPHVARLLEEGKTIGGSYIKTCKSLLNKYVLPDKISKIKLEDLRRKDLLEFRTRLVQTIGPSRTVQVVMARLKTCLKELFFREEMDRDITSGIGAVKYEEVTRDRFSKEELVELFKDRPGPWGTPLAYDIFLVAATTGMRRGEILALQWEDVNFKENLIYIRHALKNAGRGDSQTVGLPKWGKVRTTPMHERTREAILRQPTHGPYVFSHPDGKHLGVTFWGNFFKRAMKTAGIERPLLTPHSFRHTVNSIWRASGVPDFTIRSALGWTTEKVQDGYSHVSVEDLRKLPEV